MIKKSPNAMHNTLRKTYAAIFISPAFAIDIAKIRRHQATASLKAADRLTL